MFLFLDVFFSQELIDKTPEDHPDQESLQQALNTVKTLATAIDESKNVADKAIKDEQALRGLEGMIDGHVELVSPHRKFIRQLGVIDVSFCVKRQSITFLFFFNSSFVLFRYKCRCLQ